jgi:hypothetical protein
VFRAAGSLEEEGFELLVPTFKEERVSVYSGRYQTAVLLFCSCRLRGIELVDLRAVVYKQNSSDGAGAKLPPVPGKAS